MGVTPGYRLTHLLASTRISLDERNMQKGTQGHFLIFEKAEYSTPQQAVPKTEEPPFELPDMILE